MGLLIAYGVVMALVLVGAWLVHSSYDKTSLKEDLITAGAVYGVVFGAVVLIWALAMGLTTTSSARHMEAFFESNAEVYEDAVERLRLGVPAHYPDANEAGTGGYLFFESANLNQVQYYSALVRQNRDAVLAYNFKLKSHRFWQDHLLWGLMWANVSDDIRPIVVN